MSTVLSVDPGFGNIKVMGPYGSLVLPSRVAINGHGRVHDGMTRGRRVPLDISIGPHEFYVGRDAHEWGRPVESLDLDRFTGAPEMQALFYAAFTEYQAQCEGDLTELSLIVGLPLAILTGDSGQVQRMVRLVKRFFQGDHVWRSRDTEHGITVVDVSVTSQAVGSLYDFLLTGEGRMTPPKRAAHQREIGICNIGFNTVDLLVARRGSLLQRFTSGDTRGVRRLLDLSNRDGLWSLGEMDAQLRSRSLDTTTSLPMWASEVRGCIENAWGDTFRRFAAVVCVGGGSQLLRRELSTYFGDKFQIPEDPILSTAKGLYKFMLMRAKRGQEKGSASKDG